VAAAAVAATVAFDSPDSRSSTPDELTPALAQHRDNRPDDDDDDTATACTMPAASAAAAAAGANRSTSFGKYNACSLWTGVSQTVGRPESNLGRSRQVF